MYVTLLVPSILVITAAATNLLNQDYDIYRIEHS